MISVALHGISKSYTTGKGKKRTSIEALSDISFEVEKGEVFGLIGPDGAGKTTLFRILTTLLLADRGTAGVEGLDVVRDMEQIRSQVGYMPGRFSLYQDLTVQENLNFFATVFNTSVQENYALIKDIYVQIEPFKKRRAGALSGGMKQKLALCCALIHRPTVLFLDEPTTGVDPVSRREFWQMLHSLKEQGITILVSTPYMDEASLCDRIALVQQGHIMRLDTPAAIVAQYRQPLFAVTGSDMYGMLVTLRKFPQVESCFAFGESLHVTFLEKDPDIRAVLAVMSEKGFSDVQIKPVEANIEDCFMELLGNRQTQRHG